MECPTCKGEKVLKGMLPRGHRTELRCVTCGGEGVVQPDHIARLERGFSFRARRHERRETIFECAQRLGVRPSQLSSYESGLHLDEEVIKHIEGAVHEV